MPAATDVPNAMTTNPPDETPTAAESCGGEIDADTINLAILEALADGVDPMTGNDLPGESVLRDARVRAALVAGMVALDKQQRLRERQSALPKQAGRPWDAEEDQRLADAYDEGTAIRSLAELHGRTTGAIKSRLAKLGKLIP